MAAKWFNSLDTNSNIFTIFFYPTVTLNLGHRRHSPLRRKSPFLAIEITTLHLITVSFKKLTGVLVWAIATWGTKSNKNLNSVYSTNLYSVRGHSISGHSITMLTRWGGYVVISRLCTSPLTIIFLGCFVDFHEMLCGKRWNLYVENNFRSQGDFHILCNQFDWQFIPLPAYLLEVWRGHANQDVSLELASKELYHIALGP